MADVDWVQVERDAALQRADYFADACLSMKAENERLRGAVEYLRANVKPPAPDHPAWCWPDVWKEFERRVSG